MLIVVVIALLGLAYGQQYPCCTVKQWEMGEYFQLGTVQSGKGSYIEVRPSLSYVLEGFFFFGFFYIFVRVSF